MLKQTRKLLGGSTKRREKRSSMLEKVKREEGQKAYRDNNRDNLLPQLTTHTCKNLRSSMSDRARIELFKQALLWAEEK